MVSFSAWVAYGSRSQVKGKWRWRMPWPTYTKMEFMPGKWTKRKRSQWAKRGRFMSYYHMPHARQDWVHAWKMDRKKSQWAKRGNFLPYYHTPHVRQNWVCAWKLDGTKSHDGKNGAILCIIICPTNAKTEFMPGKWTEKKATRGSSSCHIMICH